MRTREVPLPPRTGETARVREVVAGALSEADVPSAGETARTRDVVIVAGEVTVAELAMLPAKRPVRSVPVALPVVTAAVVPGIVVVPLELGAMGFRVVPLGGVPVLVLTRTVPLPVVATFGLTTLDEETVGLTTNALRDTGEGVVVETMAVPAVATFGLTTFVEETVGLTTNVLRDAGDGFVDDATVEPARPFVTFAVTVGAATPAAVVPVPAIVRGAEVPATVVAGVVPLAVPAAVPAVAALEAVVPFVVAGTKTMPLASSTTA
jgi:hypothetical protein